MNTTQVAFGVDKNSKPLAYRWSFLAMRWFKVGYEAAKLMVSTGDAVVVVKR